MTVLGLTVGRNEAGRYLQPMLDHMSGVLDQHFFYDDHSTDDTLDVVYESGCQFSTRPADVPSFTENEGAFRFAAWHEFEDAMSPHLGDWVLVIDCDEVLVGSTYDTRHDLELALEFIRIRQIPGVGIMLDFDEIFGYDTDGCPLVRVDHLWGTIHAPRLFQYRPDAQYAFGSFGVPAVPTYVMAGAWIETNALRILHYGYADEADQASKYERYVGLMGHSQAHVESILDSDKTLVRRVGPYPPEMRHA